MRSGWGPALRLARDVFPVVVVAYLVFHLLRSHVCERYLVPSASMEPTLHGALEGGDVVAVDKTAFWPWRDDQPLPWDLVVARNRHEPHGGDHIVKRLIALGPATVVLRHGDVYVGAGSAPPELVVKPPEVARDLRQTAYAWPEPSPTADPPASPEYLHADSGWSVEADGIRLRAGTATEMAAVLRHEAQDQRLSSGEAIRRYLPGHLSTDQAIDTSFLNSRGVRLGRSPIGPRDLGVELDLTVESSIEAIQLVVEELEVYRSVRYARDGTGRFQVMGVDHGEAFRAPVWPASGDLELCFGYVDGRFFFEVQGVRVLTYPLELPVEATPRTRRYEPFANLIHVGVVAPDSRFSAIVRRVHYFHDVYHEPRSTTFVLEDDEVFLLGDNTFDSSDSRDHPQDPWRLEDLVGRPFAILGPMPRSTWLSRRR